MLNYLRETQETRMASPGRRLYNYASTGVILAVMTAVFAGVVPVWIFWLVYPVSLVLDALLTRRWAREDALRDYRAIQRQ